MVWFFTLVLLQWFLCHFVDLRPPLCIYFLQSAMFNGCHQSLYINITGVWPSRYLPCQSDDVRRCTSWPSSNDIRARQNSWYARSSLFRIVQDLGVRVFIYTSKKRPWVVQTCLAGCPMCKTAGSPVAFTDWRAGIAHVTRKFWRA